MHEYFVIQIVINWKGGDEESMISDYEIGLSSDPNNEIPDIHSYSTQGHQHYNIYHPELTQGMTFYLMIVAINKAQLSTRKVNVELIQSKSYYYVP